MGQDHVDERVAEMTAHYKAIYGDVRREPGFQEPMFEGIADMIGALRARDSIMIGAVTGKSRRGLELIVDTHGLDGTFIVSRTADDCPSKPHPAMVLECCAATGIAPSDTLVSAMPSTTFRWRALPAPMRSASPGAMVRALSWPRPARSQSFIIRVTSRIFVLRGHNA